MFSLSIKTRGGNGEIFLFCMGIKRVENRQIRNTGDGNMQKIEIIDRDGKTIEERETCVPPCLPKRQRKGAGMR